MGLLLVPVLLATSQAQEKAPPGLTPEAPPVVTIPDYIRFSRAADPTHRTNSKSVGHFEKDGVKVSLVGAVHIGYEAYYRQLNGLFKDVRRGALRNGGPAPSQSREFPVWSVRRLHPLMGESGLRWTRCIWCKIS